MQQRSLTDADTGLSPEQAEHEGLPLPMHILAATTVRVTVLQNTFPQSVPLEFLSVFHGIQVSNF
jgi:hypothetical protein